MKTLRRLGIAIAVLAAVIAIVATSAAVMVANLDTARIESAINRALLATKQRTLKIEGPLTLSFRPGFGIRLGRASLSEHASAAVFARFDSAQLSLQWLPLLSRRVVIDAVELNGLAIVVARDRNGRLNISDLLETGPGGQWTFEIGAIHLAQGQLIWRDQTRDQAFTLDDLALRTGRIANEGDPSRGRLEISGRLRSAHAPQADARLNIVAHYELDLVKQHYAANGVAMQLNGRLADAPPASLAVNIAAIAMPGKNPANHIDIDIEGTTLVAQTAQHALTIAAPQLQLTGGMLRGAPLALTFATGSAENVALSGRIQTPLAADFTAHTMRLDGLAAELDIVAPHRLVRPLKVRLHGSAGADLAQGTATADLNGELDTSRLAAQLNIAGFTPPSIRFDFAIDRIDTGRYLKAASAATTGQSAPGAPLAAPGNLDLQGTLKIGALQAAGIKARNLRLAISTHDGRWAVATEPR